jgi:hypothetical protein
VNEEQFADWRKWQPGPYRVYKHAWSMRWYVLDANSDAVCKCNDPDDAEAIRAAMEAKCKMMDAKNGGAK